MLPGPNNNVALGQNAMLDTTGSSNNIALGQNTLQNNNAVSFSIAVGPQAMASASNSTNNMP